jgi:nucleoside-diphosphate-sugar epimerase
LLDTAIASRARRFILVSSNSPAGLNASATQLMMEDDPPRPYLNYGLSKLQAEWMVNDAHRRGLIQSVILRPCWFYGPNQPLRQTTFFKMIKGGHPIVVGKGDNLRSMSYVDNTVQGLLLARDVDKAAGQTYWITDRRPYSFIEILQTVGRLLDVSIRPRYLPRFSGDCARLVDSLLQMAGVYNQEIHVAGELGESIAVSTDKAKRELGYDPPIELEEGMRRSIEWCRAQGVDI